LSSEMPMSCAESAARDVPQLTRGTEPHDQRREGEAPAMWCDLL